MKSSSHTRLAAVLGTALVTTAAAVAPTTAASASKTRHHPDPTTTVLASGLDNPRHLAFDRHGRLLVAEAGTGGSGPCMPGPEGGEVCFGTSGAVSKVWKGGSTRVLTGLPSLAARDGSSAIGPSDLVPGRHGRVTLSIGLGANPAVREDLPAVGKRLMGTLTAARLYGHKRWVVADLAAYEAAKDPDKAGPDSDPTGFIRSRRGFVATDAGGNTLLKVSRYGKVRTLAVFPSRLVPSPSGGDDIDMQAVPTSVVKGDHGAYYVSQLTGFPFPAGQANIFKVVPGKKPTVVATGLTNVTDLAWHRGRLYAVQISDEGLASSDDPTALPSGSLVKVVRGGAPVTVADNLPAPYGVAFRHGSAYVTTCTVCPGGGGVAKVSLH
jgi:hypothetical protein